MGILPRVVPSREIHHENPLSPCVFVLRIERLAHLILKAVEKSSLGTF